MRKIDVELCSGFLNKKNSAPINFINHKFTENYTNGRLNIDKYTSVGPNINTYNVWKKEL